VGTRESPTADAADVSGFSSVDATVSGATRAKSLNSLAHATMKCEEPSLWPAWSTAPPLSRGQGAPDMSAPAPYRLSAACSSASARLVWRPPPPTASDPMWWHKPALVRALPSAPSAWSARRSVGTPCASKPS
jgi:hypothetical protein